MGDANGALSRREVLIRGALLGGSLTWRAPVMTTITPPLFGDASPLRPCECPPVGEECRLGVLEFVGRPEAEPAHLNGALHFVDEPSNGCLSLELDIQQAERTEFYNVQGTNMREACNDIMNNSGPIDLTDGKHYIGETVLDVKHKWTCDAAGAEGFVTITITEVMWTITIRLPKKPAAIPQADWDTVVNEVKKHEDGHVKRYQDGMRATRAEVVGQGFSLRCEDATEERINEMVDQLIRSSSSYNDMEASNEAYDDPLDAQANPSGTNHGTENGQNARWTDT